MANQPHHAMTAGNTFPALLVENAAKRGARPAIREKHLGIWQTYTWQQVCDHVRNLAYGMASLDVKAGDHVAVIGENRPQLYMAMMAAQCIGAIPVPLYQDAVAQEMVYVLQDASVGLVVVEDQEQVDKMLEVRDQCPHLKHIVFDDPRGLRHYKDPALLSCDALAQKGQVHRETHPRFFDESIAAIQPEDTGAMFYTSGTTGKPKGVVLTHHALIDRARAVEVMPRACSSKRLVPFSSLRAVNRPLCSRRAMTSSATCQARAYCAS